MQGVRRRGRQKKQWVRQYQRKDKFGFEIHSKQQKTGKGGDKLLRHHQWCPNNLQGFQTEEERTGNRLHFNPCHPE